ncbi:hypothetical protein LMG27198_19750 [Methylocystis echinoides]|uniref:Uncharacterized protein n=1 Tax=Methylocystis echinoides TaxID=29468 RepID=A0A9W6GTW4_9HYPH|nr:hypothetical protein LMG27198_19750 [Methylocystis echinoides]
MDKNLDSTPETWAERRACAMRLAAQLPDNRDDAESVVGLLCDLLEWLHPGSKVTEGQRHD